MTPRVRLCHRTHTYASGAGDYNAILPTLAPDSSLVPITGNLIDKVWSDRPKRPSEPVVVHEEKYAGKSSKVKVEEVRKELRKKATNWGLVVAQLDDIACKSLGVQYR